MTIAWGFKSLGEISNISYGYTQSADREEVGPRFLRITDIQNDQVDWNSVPFCAIAKEEFPRFRLATDDILFARTGATTGKSFLVKDPPEAVFASYLIRLRLQGKELLPEFVTLFFQSDQYWKVVREGMIGSAQGGFNASKLGALSIPIPPLSEQQRIVSILGEAFEGIAIAKANAERNVANARALFRAELETIFSRGDSCWVSSRLADVTTKIGSGATPRGGEQAYKSQGVSLIRSLNVHDLEFKYAKLAFLDDLQAGELQNVEVLERDVFLNITGASVARCVVVPGDVLPARVNQHVAIIRPIAAKLDAEFLHYLLISKPYKDQLLQTGEDAGATRQAITKAQIQEFDISFPSTVAEQRAIVSRIDAMLIESQRLARMYERKVEALDSLKKSLLHRAFTGQL